MSSANYDGAGIANSTIEASVATGTIQIDIAIAGGGHNYNAKRGRG